MSGNSSCVPFHSDDVTRLQNDLVWSMSRSDVILYGIRRKASSYNIVVKPCQTQSNPGLNRPNPVKTGFGQGLTWFDRVWSGFDIVCPGLAGFHRGLTWFERKSLFSKARLKFRFDRKIELFSKIEIPCVDDNRKWDCYLTIMFRRGYIHVCVECEIEISGFIRNCIKLWKLDEYGNLKEVVNYQLMPQDNIISYLHPLHIIKNGNWLMHEGDSFRPRIYAVDLKKMKRMKDRGNSYDEYELYAGVRMDTSPEQVRYT
ncbi:hypothetical protein Tco_0716437 [Tanacetum coccineum]